MADDPRTASPEADAFERTREALRRRLKGVRRAFPAEKARAASVAIAAHLRDLPEFGRARTVALYAPVRGEVDTAPVLAACVAGGKTVAYPRVVREGEPLVFARPDRGALRPGLYGIPEPAQDAPEVLLDSIDLVVVPGIAFDTRGARLGSGKGYYDRTLAAGARRPFAVGVAYDFQIVPEIPERPGDRRVDAVVTEKRIAVAKSAAGR